MDGVPFPQMEGGCPECGSETFSCIENCKQGVSITVGEMGGVADMNIGDLIEVNYSLVECSSCDEILVEDGEIVHESL